MGQRREIVVVGEGGAGAVADLCVLSLGLNVAAGTSAKALETVAQLAGKVLAAAHAHGIEPSDIQTSQVSLEDLHDIEKKRVTARIAHYGLVVEVAGLAEAGPLLATLADAAGDSLQVRSLRLAMSDPKPLVEEARRAAVADGLERARQLAEAAGVGLGRIVSIDEGAGSAVESDGPYRRMSGAALAASSVPIEGGSSSVTVRVTLRMAIAD
jgi:hypothetical protein